MRVFFVFTLKNKYFAKPTFHKVVYNFEFLLQLCEVSMETVSPVFRIMDRLPTQVRMQAVPDPSSVYCALTLGSFNKRLAPNWHMQFHI